MRSTNGVRTTSDATSSIKENKGIDVLRHDNDWEDYERIARGRNNVDSVNNVNTTKTKKSKASSTKKKSIDLDNPCSSCPALSTKDKRFVDGEGSGKNQ